MQPPAKIPLMLSLIVAVLVGDSCRADSFVGLWQTEAIHRSAPGFTNTLAAFEMVEFFKDFSFKMADVLIIDGVQWTNVSFTGTYKMIATNQVSLRAIPHNIPPGSTPSPLTVSCSIVGQELKIPKFITSVVAEFSKYRRAK